MEGWLPYTKDARREAKFVSSIAWLERSTGTCAYQFLRVATGMRVDSHRSFSSPLIVDADCSAPASRAEPTTCTRCQVSVSTIKRNPFMTMGRKKSLRNSNRESLFDHSVCDPSVGCRSLNDHNIQGDVDVTLGSHSHYARHPHFTIKPNKRTISESAIGSNESVAITAAFLNMSRPWFDCL